MASKAANEGGIVETIKTVVYALLIAYTNDFLSREDMAAASAGLIFLNGFGAIFGPLVRHSVPRFSSSTNPHAVWPQVFWPQTHQKRHIR